jgi:Rrf2 family protein
VRVSAKVDYAVRAIVELATADAGPLKGDQLAAAQDIPLKFLENILGELRRAGMVGSQRGSSGGYWLAMPPEEISVADIIRAVEGPLADVHGTPPERLAYHGSAAALREVWIATRANLRAVLETVTVADIAKRSLPRHLVRLVDDPQAWRRR